RTHRDAVHQRSPAPRDAERGGAAMIRRPSFHVAATAALMIVLLAAPAALRAETIALTGATVHTVTGATLENATVVMTDGKIAAVGAGVTPPAGATIVS